MIRCPSCGGGLRFDIKTQQMVCDLCDSHFEPEDVDTTSGDSTEEGVNAYNVAVHICPSCGAELMTNDANDAVGFCPFCGGASMIFSQIRQQWKPDVIIPFQVTEDYCKILYHMEAARSPFISGKYRKKSLTDSFRGIYMPYWIIDAEYDDDFEVRVITNEQVGSEGYDVMEYHFAGHATGSLCYVHDASVNFSDDISEMLAPYSLTDSKDFSQGYIAGFYAEISDTDMAEYDDWFGEVFSYKQGEFLGNDSNVLCGIDTDKGRVSIVETAMIKPMKHKKYHVKRTLLPVWFMSKRDKDRIAYAAVNGATGKIAVDLPVSPLRILLFSLGIGAGLYLISLLLPAMNAPVCLGICTALTFIAHLIMEGAYQKVLEAKLNIISKKKDKIAWWSTIQMMLIVLAALFPASGSGLKWYMIFLVVVFAVILLISLIIFLNLIVRSRKRVNMELRKNLPLKYRAELIQEIKQYKRLKTVFFIIELVFVGAAIAIFATRFTSAVCLYALCFLMAADLFGAAIAVIRFQRALSMRRPPQMEKKGALYDEN